MEASVELKWQDELNNNVTTLEELKEYAEYLQDEFNKEYFIV